MSELLEQPEAASDAMPIVAIVASVAIENCARIFSFPFDGRRAT